MHYKNRSQENILRKKRTSRAPNLYSYRYKNKDKYHTKKFPRNAANQRKIPSFKSDDDPNTYPCYSSNDQKNVLLSNASPIGVHKMQSADCIRAVLDCCFSTWLDRQIFLHSWWESNENFPGATSVISRPATCQVAIAGEHYFAAKLVWRVEVMLRCWKLLFSTRTWHSIWFST